MPVDEKRAQKKRKALTHDRCKRRAHAAHVQHEDKKEIEHNIRDGSDADKEKGALGIAHAAQHRADGIVAVNKEQSEQADRRICPGLAVGLGRRVHPAEYPAAQHKANDAQRDRSAQEKGEHRADKTADALSFSRADVLRDDDLPGVGKADRQICQESRQITADRDG